MLLLGVLVKILFIVVAVVHFSHSFYDIPSVLVVLLFSGYFALHSLVIESVFELFAFLALSFLTTIWFGVVLAHTYALLFVLAALLSFDMFFLLLIILLPTSLISCFGYYLFRISAVVKIQNMYVRYQNFVTCLKLDLLFTLLFLIRIYEHFGLFQFVSVVTYSVILTSFFWQLLCYRCVRHEQGDILQLLLSLSWVQPLVVVYVIVLLPKVWAHAQFFVLCFFVILLRCVCILDSVRVSANFHKGLLDIHERVESMKLELRSPLPWNTSADPESHLLNTHNNFNATELKQNSTLFGLPASTSEPDLAIHCSTRYYDTFSSFD